MTTAKDVMHADAMCVADYESLETAARRMRDLGIGALPICVSGPPERLTPSNSTESVTKHFSAAQLRSPITQHPFVKLPSTHWYQALIYPTKLTVTGTVEVPP